MIDSSPISNFLTWAILLAALCFLNSTMVLSEDNISGGTNGEQPVAADTSLGPVKFEEFKLLFHKSYKSVTEELRRQALFVSNLFLTIISQIRFREKRTSAFERVNEMSDWTEAEFQSTLIDASIYSEQLSAEVVKELTDDNSKPRIGLQLRKYTRGIFNKLSKTAVNLFDRTDKLIEDFFTGLMLPAPKYRPDLPDEMFIDHREGNCLNKVRNQGKCGSCYVFSTVALYEWAYCKANSSRIQFSEKFVVDCGTLAGLRGCKGDAELYVGHFVKKFGLELAANYKYTDKQRECPYDLTKTPREKMGAIRVKKPGLGLVWPNMIEKELKISPLIIGIFVSNILRQYGGGLDDGKGCDRLEVRDRQHSVLLVGHGRQDGHEYWLIRNSHGARWGESGYYKLRKDSKCLGDYGVARNIKALSKGIASGKLTNFKFYENPEYDEQPLKTVKFVLSM